MATDRKETEQRLHWYKPERCSICTNFTWFHPIVVEEPVEAPEPRFTWLLCKPCHTALLEELSRSSINSSIRLRIAMGFVAAERSPNAYAPKLPPNDSEQLRREFAWFAWFIIIFAALHLVILIIWWVGLK